MLVHCGAGGASTGDAKPAAAVSATGIKPTRILSMDSSRARGLRALTACGGLPYESRRRREIDCRAASFR
jgi:hypothetical protein